MGVNREKWYIYYGGCDSWWRKMVLTVFFKNIFEVLDGLCV